VAIADFRLVADLQTRARPQEPVDHFHWALDPPTLKHQLEHPGAGVSRRHLVVDGETPVGIASLSHPEEAAWGTARVAKLSLGLVPEAAAAASEALGDLVAAAHADHPKAFYTWSAEGEAYLNNVLRAAGFRHVRTGISQELDLVTGRDRLLALREASRTRMASQGVTLRHAGGEPVERLWAHLLPLLNQTHNDIPHTVEEPDRDDSTLSPEISPPPSERADRVWLAWDGDRLVALSLLEFPVERGNVWTGYTACDREYRGRGIAQAVKNESVGQAIELGWPRIRTSNDTENEPMLAINRKLGYIPMYTILEWLKIVG
jgi:RimJ/RimL family protein N-acetyltransferase